MVAGVYLRARRQLTLAIVEVQPYGIRNHMNSHAGSAGWLYVPGAR